MHGGGTDTPIVWYEGPNGTTDRRFLMTDQQGSVIAIQNAAGQSLATNTYDAYGLAGPANLGRFQYTGQAYIPEAGLYYYKARMYSPSLERFMQADPSGYGDGLNLYAYTHGDPVNMTDPSGMQADGVPNPGTTISGVTVIGNRSQSDDNSSDSSSQSLSVGGNFPLPHSVLPAVMVTARPKAKIPWGTIGLFALGVAADFIIPEIAIPAELAEGAALLSKACFTAGTLVVTSHGLVPIEKIKPGDMVLSRDPATGATGYKRVLAVKSPSKEDIYQVTVDVSDRRHHIHHHAQFKVTAGHPWREANGRWVATKELHLGDRLVSEFGRAVRVSAVVDQHREAPTYNLEVADYHTYFVGRDRVWVHNACLAAKILEAIKEEAFSEGTLGELEGPFRMANPDPALGPNQVRYQAQYFDEFGEQTDYSVNYDPDSGQFGTIKPSSGRGP